MNLEDTLRRTFESRLDAVEVTPGDLAGARVEGRRLRVRRRVAVGAAAVTVVALAAAGTLVGTGRVTVGPSGEVGHWRELPTPPLSPRADALSVWTGREVIVLGGDRDPCPPTADCAAASRALRDGAAYAPETNSWRPLPPAPVPVGSGDRLIVADGVVVLRHGLLHGSRWFTYEPDHNRWSRIGGVPADVGDLPSAIGPRVYVPAGGRVAVYDVTRFRWILLPPDRIRPALAQRRVTATSAGPVVTGYDATQPNDGRAPSVVLADVWDGRAWRRLPATGQLGEDWSWTGTRMVDPDPTQVDGGDVDPFPHPYPTGGLLDPATGAWSPLPAELSDRTGGGWGLSAVGGRWVATYGQVYDTGTGRVTTLPRPDDAPELDTTATWADGRLFAFGGATYADRTETTDRAWLYTP